MSYFVEKSQYLSVTKAITQRQAWARRTWKLHLMITDSNINAESSKSRYDQSWTDK